uniref:Uncharacterized protein n=1 Tax=viral metagenome TaxID=1070528 RepID=A0A6C0JMW4_9ZZZZ
MYSDMMVKGGLLLLKDVGLENLTNLSFGNCTNFYFRRKRYTS